MKFHSTRGGQGVTLEQALVQGLAPDGGLYVPDALPSLSPDAFKRRSPLGIAADYLQPFFEGTELADALDDDSRAILKRMICIHVPNLALKEDRLVARRLAREQKQADMVERMQ